MLKKHPRIAELAQNTNGSGQISKAVGQNSENPGKKETMSARKESSREQTKEFWGNKGIKN